MFLIKEKTKNMFMIIKLKEILATQGIQEHEVLAIYYFI